VIDRVSRNPSPVFVVLHEFQATRRDDRHHVPFWQHDSVLITLAAASGQCPGGALIRINPDLLAALAAPTLHGGRRADHFSSHVWHHENRLR